ncbi:hypothetical protein CASFOL_040953 [Castilleja foliolosa]|uniref:Uncharacterized protein n=1 Tax=Castilleja foliolosa TaxID=1961234 RepID=A0ABD3BDD6_9LAMI
MAARMVVAVCFSVVLIVISAFPLSSEATINIATGHGAAWHYRIGKYISYPAISGDQPGHRAGTPPTPNTPANPYHRGCDQATRCGGRGNDDREEIGSPPPPMAVHFDGSSGYRVSDNRKLMY